MVCFGKGNFVNLCQKSPTRSLNFWNVIKQRFLPPAPSSLVCLCPKPLADVEVLSNASRCLLSWENGSQCSFSRKPHKTFSKLALITPMKEQRNGKEGAYHERQCHSTRLKDQRQQFGESSSYFIFILWDVVNEGCQFLYLLYVRRQICLDWCLQEGRFAFFVVQNHMELFSWNNKLTKKENTSVLWKMQQVWFYAFN